MNHQQQINHLITASATIAAQLQELKALRKQVVHAIRAGGSKMARRRYSKVALTPGASYEKAHRLDPRLPR
jgi:hypothetical protein